jgi:hypothetical protein
MSLCCPSSVLAELPVEQGHCKVVKHAVDAVTARDGVEKAGEFDQPAFARSEIRTTPCPIDMRRMSALLSRRKRSRQDGRHTLRQKVMSKKKASKR